jgi:UPF0755 protein
MKLTMKLFLLVLIVAITAVAGMFEYQRFMTTPLKLPTDTYHYTVKKGSNLKHVIQHISDEQLSDVPPIYLALYSRWKGNSNQIKTGEFKIPAGTTLPQFLEHLIEGKAIQRGFTIIEGTTSQQLIDSIAKNDLFEHTLATPTVESVMAALGKPDEHGEGRFHPETYYFPAGTTDIDFLRRAYKKMETELAKAWQNKAADLPYKTPYEALIMASIIEKETGIAEERPEIAGVFVRRLNIGMLLQTDPTVIYGMGDSYDGDIRRRDLRKDTPYNTYTRAGLPPTPIALPSQAAIEAALHPKAGKSLYFVATGSEGRHTFSNTLKEHNAAVQRYLRKIRSNN